MSNDIKGLARTAERLLREGSAPAAIDTYRALLQHDDQNADAWYNLAWLQRMTRDFAGALASYEKALDCGVAQPEAAHVNRAAILSEQLNRPREAEAELHRAVALNDSFIPAWLNLGNLYEDDGALQSARDAYATALAIQPENGRANARLAILDVFTGKQQRAKERIDAALAMSRRDPVGDAELRYANAQLLDARGDYDNAFVAIAAANDQARTLIDPHRRYHPATHDALIDAIITAFPARLRASESSKPPARPAPMFITGMFRSGSTLCESVLARHSRVTAGGELEIVPGVVAEQPSYPRGPFDFDALRGRYLVELSARHPDADLVTDKRPDNFLHIGLLKAIFPAARIVHTVRDPLDTALSAFFLYFEDSVAYASRLDHIAHYYRAYRRLMGHWQRVFGDDLITFDYDRFVAAPDIEARALFNACGLPWEDDCAPRPAPDSTVRTPSAWQVRQPIHRRSSGRWRNYAKHIEQLRMALDAD